MQDSALGDAHAGPPGSAEPRREPTGAGRALLQRSGDSIWLRFEPRYSGADLEVVRALPGRRWSPEQLAWELPANDRVLDALARAFPTRLQEVPRLPALAAATERRIANLPTNGGETDTGPPRPAGLSRSAGEAEAMPRAPLHTGTGAGASAIDSAASSTSEAGGGVAAARRAPEPPAALDHSALLAAATTALRTREYSVRTERAYSGWLRDFFAFISRDAAGECPPRPEDARAYLAWLAAERRLAARSRNQAASALRFFFNEVLRCAAPVDLPRAKGPHRMPLVLSHREVLHVLRQLTGKYFLIVVLLYSAGLRIEECLRLRVKDIDFELRQILIRDGKGRKDRYVPLALRAAELLRAQIARVRNRHARDRAAGAGWAPLPAAMHRKDPGAGFEIGWQWVFPANTIGTDPTTGRRCRWPLHASAAQREVKRAVRSSGIPKSATCHTFRHSFATEALRGGCDIRTLQSLLGHNDVRTTMIYLHVIEQTGLVIRSPLDRPDDVETTDDDFEAGTPRERPAVRWELGARQWSAKYGRPARPER